MKRRHYTLIHRLAPPNRWDGLAVILIVGVIFAFAWFARQVTLPYQVGEPIPLSLSFNYLPGYALHTILRMAVALFCSFLFTFGVGTLAAKSRFAERIIIPLIDVLQAVPVLGFLSVAVVWFMSLFPGSLLGPECAAIFAIFTGQAWNMTLSFYQSMSSVPHDLQEVAALFRLSAWQRFWRIEVPFAMPALLWNAMISMSGGWFFIVASEAIAVSNQHIALPGVGSYINLAITQADFTGMGAAIVTMLIIVLLTDQLFFRPLLCWSEKFKPLQEIPDEETYRSWVISLLRRTRWLRYLSNGFRWLSDSIIHYSPGQAAPCYHEVIASRQPSKRKKQLRHLLLLLVGGGLAWLIFREIKGVFNQQEILHVFFLGVVTGAKVFLLIILCSIIWVPIGVWIGIHPRWTRIASPMIQILAAFPADLLYPVVVLCTCPFQLNPELSTAPLMVLGAQWYILFNVIAGAAALPKDLYQATANFGVRGWLWWRRFILPGIYPYYITGAISAAGGAWNASILAEYVSWGKTTLKATGLGGYIKQATISGAFSQIALGIGVMCLFVIILNRLFWRPLYQLAQHRFHL